MNSLAPLRIERDLAQTATFGTGWFCWPAPRCNVTPRAVAPSKAAALIVQDHYPSPLAGFGHSPAEPRIFLCRRALRVAARAALRLIQPSMTKDGPCSTKS